MQGMTTTTTTMDYRRYVFFLALWRGSPDSGGGGTLGSSRAAKPGDGRSAGWRPKRSTGAECDISSRRCGQNRLACPGGRPFSGAAGLPALEKRGGQVGWLAGWLAGWLWPACPGEGKVLACPGGQPLSGVAVLPALEEKGGGGGQVRWSACLPGRRGFCLPWRRVTVTVTTAKPALWLGCPGEEFLPALEEGDGYHGQVIN